MNAKSGAKVLGEVEGEPADRGTKMNLNRPKASR
jgi:hypothetical protein